MTRYLKFADSEFYRSSVAWCPVTGKAVKAHEPRIVSNFILEPQLPVRIYHRFEATQGFTAYNDDPACFNIPGNTTDYLVDWMDVLEACNPSVERILLGSSYEGRPLEALRLGPADRKHFVIDCMIHGNESDGLPGSLKAMEILLTHPDFEKLRNDFTLFFMPCCNPDGFYFGTRDIRKLGPHPSGVDKYINLNRVWPWYWDEFTPTANESKGAVPLDCPEAQAMYTWRTTGNGGQPTPVAFLMDQHSTAGDGARYQSRDRTFREIDEYDWFTCWADYIIYRYLKATQAKRVQEDGDPDLFVNYFRSRYVPHWHTWNSTRTREENGGIPIVSMVNEYNKVAYVTVDTDPETYQSACNYTLDYALCCALVMQGDYCTPRDAVLVENTYGSPSINYFNNAGFTIWNEKAGPSTVESYRPSYWDKARSEMLESSREERHIDYQGRNIVINPTLKLEVPLESTVGPSDVHDVQVATDVTHMFVLASVSPTGDFYFSTWSGSTNLTITGADSVADTTQQLRFAGVTDTLSYRYVLLGTDLVGILLTYWNGGVKTTPATYASARMNAATAWDPANKKLYILGGEATTGVYSRTVLVVDTSGAGTITELGTNLLATADSGGEAVFCSGGSLDGMAVVVGGKEVHSSKLRVVIVNPATPVATEYLVTLTGSTLPRNLVSCALSYDGVDTIWVYGGEDPATGAVHPGVWTLQWSGSAWSVNDEQLLADAGDAGDPEDYGGTSYWNRLWSRWRAARSYYLDTGYSFTLLLGGVEEDASTGLPLPGPYTGGFLHDSTDGTLTKPENQNYAYSRTNVRFSVAGYTKVCTSWSAKAGPETTSGYIRINNAPGSTATGTLTTRRNRTYYMHPPRWWWREHAALDLAGGNPLDLEDEWRAYVRVYQDSQAVGWDAPMLNIGTLWPHSWVPEGTTMGSEEIQWDDCLDPRWMHVSMTMMPQASFLCKTDELLLVDVQCAGLVITNRFTLSFYNSGDDVARTYVRDQVHGIADPTIRLAIYDSERGTQTCEVPLFWGGYHKDTARARFDTPIIIDFWQHVSYGCGIIVNNAGAIGKAWIPGPINQSLWAAPADLRIKGGGWWAEPIVHEITDAWVVEYAAKQEPNGALLLGDRDATWGQVSQRSTFKYIERFTRADATNLGDFWDVITQTGDGWDIYSNAARCSEVGWERWDAYPYLRDVSILGDARVGYAGGRIGFFTRIHWATAGTGIAHGYLGTLYHISTGNTLLQIERVFDSAGTQGRTSLATIACPYTVGDTVELEFEAVGSTLTLIARSGETVLATCTTVDTNHIMPGAFGICGETTSSSRYVYLDSVRAEVRGTNKIRITD